MAYQAGGVKQRLCFAQGDRAPLDALLHEYLIELEGT